MLGIGINYFDRGIFYLVQLFFLFFLFRVLCFLLFFPMEGWFSHGWAYQMLVWYYPLRSSLPCHSWAYQTSVWYSPLRRSLPFWGPLALLALCAWGKAALPRTGCQKTTKGHSESSPFRLAASTFRGSGSPLSIFPRGYHQFPLREQAASPFGRKPQDPWGSSWPRLGPSRGESGPCAKRGWKVENRIPGYQLEYHITCGSE